MRLKYCSDISILFYYLTIHPFAPEDQTRGYLEMINDLEDHLSEITGFDAKLDVLVEQPTREIELEGHRRQLAQEQEGNPAEFQGRAGLGTCRGDRAGQLSRGRLCRWAGRCRAGDGQPGRGRCLAVRPQCGQRQRHRPSARRSTGRQGQGTVVSR